MNCKTGDIALVVRGPDSGKVVTVLAPLRMLEIVETSFGPAYVNDARSLPAWRVDRHLTVFAMGDRRRAAAKVCADANLLPLRPPASDESDTQDQDLPAECVA